MDRIQVACFLAVAEHLSFTKAAQELHMIRRAVEERLKRIRQEKGKDPRRFFELVALLERWKNV